jgi:hypothetical protein
MTKTIQSPANTDYTFGLNFDYSVWPKDTDIDLVSVNWNNDYKDVVNWQTQAQIDAYLDSLAPTSIRLERMSYLRPGEPFAINLPFNVANQFNYVRVKNPVQPIPGNDKVKYFYYFINEVKYQAANTTMLQLQLDVWTTYKFAMKLGNCYVERGHIGIANTNRMQNYGRDYLTTPEGMDTGGEYVIGWNADKKIIRDRAGVTEYNVLVASTVDLIKDAGTVAAPKMNTAPGSNMQGLPSGVTYYAWVTGPNFAGWLLNNADKPWLTQGIISVSIVPPIDQYIDLQSEWPTDPLDPMPVKAGDQLDVSFNMLADWRNNVNIFNNGIPEKYLKLDKFKTFPYMAIELTTWQGTPVLIKPESWRSKDAVIKIRANFVPPAQRLIAYPQNYNANTDSVSYHDYGEYLDLAAIISGFPQALIVNNSGIAYMANNKNQIAFSYQNADWSQQRALGSAQASYDVQSGAINAMSQLTQIGINAASAQTANTNQNIAHQQAVNGLAGIAGGAVGGAPMGGAGAAAGAGGGLIQAIAGNATTLMQMDANTRSTGISNAAAAQANRTQVGQAGYARDTNNDLARWAARGDYANSVAAIQAKVQDAKMLQPTTSGQVGGDAFNIVNDSYEIKLRWKWLDANHMRMIGDYWLRFGYAINRFIQFPDDYLVMTKFTYWKLSEAYIVAANIPETFKQAFRGIFEKGVTVWADPKDIGVIDIGTNEIKPGVSY